MLDATIVKHTKSACHFSNGDDPGAGLYLRPYLSQDHCACSFDGCNLRRQSTQVQQAVCAKLSFKTGTTSTTSSHHWSVGRRYVVKEGDSTSCRRDTRYVNVILDRHRDAEKGGQALPAGSKLQYRVAAVSEALSSRYAASTCQTVARMPNTYRQELGILCSGILDKGRTERPVGIWAGGIKLIDSLQPPHCQIRQFQSAAECFINVLEEQGVQGVYLHVGTDQLRAGQASRHHGLQSIYICI